MAAGAVHLEAEALIDFFARLDGIEQICALFHLAFAALIQRIFGVDQIPMIGQQPRMPLLSPPSSSAVSAMIRSRSGT